MDWTDYPEIGKSYVVCTEDRILQVKQQEALAINWDNRSDSYTKWTYAHDQSCKGIGRGIILY